MGASTARRSLDAASTARRSLDGSTWAPHFADYDLTMRTKGTLLMKMVGDFVSSKLHSQPQ